MVTRRVLVAGAAILLVGAVVVWSRRSRSSDLQVNDADLQRAADGLLAAVNPELPSNADFPDYVRNKLTWLNSEHAAGRLDVRFFHDTPENSLPPDIVMASTREDGKGIVFLSKKRFAADLLETGGVGPPFSTRQRNDFVISLVHELVHLQDSVSDEGRVWAEVNAQVVRPLRRRSEPMNQRFIDVDDALRDCQDALPCPELRRLVRLQMPQM